jgi:NAD(P)-dependent dehydrogenase (short-subunit alcohol dehydrogenase family)
METFWRFRAQVQPIPRMGTLDDVAHAALYLASDAASLINGHDLVIDGGSTAGRTAFLARSHWAHWANLAP